MAKSQNKRPLFAAPKKSRITVVLMRSARFAVDVVGRAGDVVDRDVVQPRQLHYALKRYRAAVVFVLRVVALGGFEVVRDLALGHFVLFP